VVAESSHPPRASMLSHPCTAADLHVRPPQVADGRSLANLIRSNPPLDANSTYAYLLLCRDFAATCAVAVAGDGTMAGALTGYLPPQRPNVLFVWQVAVAPAWRGQGLARSLLEHVVERPALAGVDHLETTIGPGNRGSQRLFQSFAARRACALVITPLFDARQLGEHHEPEFLHRIGPFITATAATTATSAP